MLDPAEALAALADDLATRAYVPGCPRSFVVHEPKRRVISALPFRDRIAQHKCRLHRTSEPVGFLGFTLRRAGDRVRIRLKSENVRRFRGRIAMTRGLFETGALDGDEVLARLRSWLAHAAHGHTRALRKHELERFSLVSRE